ncbi:phage head closure protein [Thermoanaerobacterium thermosaccharolyticum]|uniref:phage head closure protein n=1 Tax=Thermoanaerobacterium thermosaccharolyticum TaxID=1517 RepID=UPI003DAA2EDD
MNAGKLRHRATIQQLVSTDDGAGGSIETWQDIVTVWAAIEPLRGNERYTAQQVQSTLSHKVTIRYREGIKPQMRLTYKGRVFEVESVIDVEERHQWLELLCSEVVQ